MKNNKVADGSTGCMFCGAQGHSHKECPIRVFKRMRKGFTEYNSKYDMHVALETAKTIVL